MNRRDRFIRAMALLAGTTLACSRGQGATSASTRPEASRACPQNPAASSSSCAEYSPGLVCTWYDAVECTRQSQPAGSATWHCVSRSAPGPLGPPDLPA